MAKINKAADPALVCLLGGEVTTGWGAVLNNPNFKANSTVAVWGLGLACLAVIQAAKLKGASRIYALDTNEGRFERAMEFGATACHNPTTTSGSAIEWLKERE